MFRVFGYLKHNADGRISIDPSHMRRIDGEQDGERIQHSWTEFYPDAKEEIPYDQPTPLGNEATTLVYVDADHAHDQVTRRSVTGILMFMNSMPILWYCKRQQTVETSTYGSELVSARIAAELIMELRYKLRMLGVPLNGPTTMVGDNKAVLLNTTVPSSMLKKKHNAIAYHRVREAIAAGILRFYYVPTSENFADILTKPLPAILYQAITQPLLFAHRKHIKPTLADQKSQQIPNHKD
jgi:hypothetical protein